MLLLVDDLWLVADGVEDLADEDGEDEEPEGAVDHVDERVVGGDRVDAAIQIKVEAVHQALADLLHSHGPMLHFDLLKW